MNIIIIIIIIIVVVAGTETGAVEERRERPPRPSDSGTQSVSGSESEGGDQHALQPQTVRLDSSHSYQTIQLSAADTYRERR